MVPLSAPVTRAFLEADSHVPVRVKIFDTFCAIQTHLNCFRTLKLNSNVLHTYLKQKIQEYKAWVWSDAIENAGYILCYSGNVDLMDR